MRFVEQPVRIETVEVEEGGSKEGRHGHLLPDSVRAVICGPSGCGKTQALVSLLLSKNGLRFRNVYVYSKSLAQPKYQHLERIFAGVPEVGYHTFSNDADIVTPDQADGYSIMVFDDIAGESQRVVRQYFCMGRHFHVDSVYLCQSYAQIPKHLVRENLNLLLLFPQDQQNLRHVHANHVNSDMTFDTFLTMCRQVWEKPYNFLLINKDVPIAEGRYRSGYNTHILPEQGQSFSTS